MALMYTLKAVDESGSQYCHPCEGAYRIDNIGDHAVVTDIEKGVHLSTEHYRVIYIENASGKTIDTRHRA